MTQKEKLTNTIGQAERQTDGQEMANEEESDNQIKMENGDSDKEMDK